MRIAYVAIKGIPIGGGIEKVTEEIGSRLAAKGHEVIVYASRNYGASDGIYKGMEIRTVPSINSKSFHKLSICFQATLDVMKKRNVDLVHVHAIGPSLFSIFPRLVGIPTVVQTHGSECQRDKWGPVGRTFLKLSEYTVVYFPNRATSVSRVQQEYFKNKYGKDVLYIPNGVSPMERLAPSWLLEQAIVPNRYILFAARLVEEKGVHFLINAFRKIDTDMQLVIAGDAAHSEPYKALLRTLAGDDPRIRFVGFVTGSPMQELFSNAYLFCLPSTLEGLPVALLEAMNYGNCCLSSDIPENLEAVEDYGYTFRNRDTEDLRRVLAELVANPGMVTAKRDAAMQHVRKNYSWDRATDQLEQLYISMVAKRRTQELWMAS
ncbi:MAG: glycosyltransferase family 4 protein [Desulfobacteraceae bacterium]|jgi:glycosyltransferase involved in cell wall biosynthesis